MKTITSTFEGMSDQAAAWKIEPKVRNYLINRCLQTQTFVCFYGLNVKYVFTVKFRVMFKSEAMSVDIT